MSLTINAKTYTGNSFDTSAVGYTGPLKTFTMKDDVVLRKIDPKPTSTFSGVSKAFSKLTRTLTLTGSLTPTGDMIVDISISTPVGAASADVDSALNDMGSHLSSASFKTLVKNQLISY